MQTRTKVTAHEAMVRNPKEMQTNQKLAQCIDDLRRYFQPQWQQWQMMPELGPWKPLSCSCVAGSRQPEMTASAASMGDTRRPRMAPKRQAI